MLIKDLLEAFSIGVLKRVLVAFVVSKVMDMVQMDEDGVHAACSRWFRGTGEEYLCEASMYFVFVEKGSDGGWISCPGVNIFDSLFEAVLPNKVSSTTPSEHLPRSRQQVVRITTS